MRPFASDNTAGACPEVLAAVAEAARGHAPSYGSDPWTERATEAIRRLVGRDDAEVFLVFTGTAANALALATLAPPFGLVACHPAAHALNDEAGAPGLLGGGLQMRALPGRDGKVQPGALAAFVEDAHLHTGKPAAVTLTQATELGTVYTLEELRALRDAAGAAGLRIHMDGARLANAVETLGCTVADVVASAGLDALSLGGTKDGAISAEAVVLFDRALADAFAYRRKQAGQLASKHRFLAAQWVGLLETDAFRRNARQANAMAARLEAGAHKLGLPAAWPREANEVFLPLDARTREGLAARGWTLHDDPAWGATRIVAAWDTTEADVDALLADLAEALR